MKEETKKTHPETTSSEMHNDPMPQKSGGSKAWMIVAIIAILLLIGSIIYGYMSMKNLNKKISDQQAQINDLSNQKQTLTDAAAAAAASAAKTVTNAVTSSSDQDMIKAAAQSQCALQHDTNSATVSPEVSTFTVKTIQGNYAQLTYGCKSSQGGDAFNAVAVKTNGNWAIVSKSVSGGDFVTTAVRTQYSIPANLPK